MKTPQEIAAEVTTRLEPMDRGTKHAIAAAIEDRDREKDETIRKMREALTAAVDLLIVVPMSYPYNDRAHAVRAQATAALKETEPE